MSRARHKANGGPVKQVWNAGGEQNAAKEAEERKRGGKVVAHGEGESAKMRADKPKRRASGGRVRGEGAGADMRPLTTASKVRHVTKGEQSEEGTDKVM